MSENKVKQRPINYNLINIKDLQEIEYWTKEFGVSKEQLENAVKKVGESVSAVRRHLKMNKL